MTVRVTILDFRNGEWDAFPAEGHSVTAEGLERIMEAQATGRKPKDIGMKRVGPWRENTWPEGSREAVYEL